MSAEIYHFVKTAKWAVKPEAHQVIRVGQRAFVVGAVRGDSALLRDLGRIDGDKGHGAHQGR